MHLIFSDSQKIQLVRFGILEQMDKAVRCVSVQHLKANEQRFLQLANVDRLKKEVYESDFSLS